MLHILLIINLLNIFPFSSTDINRFLKDSATEVEWKSIYKNIRFFLDSSFKKEEIYWHKGTLTTKDSIHFTNLQLKFNTIDNSLFLKNKNQYYRIKATDLLGFTLQRGDQVQRFVKGFYQSREHQLSATFKERPQKILETVMSYEDFGTLEIMALQTSRKKSAGEIRLLLSSPNLMAVQHFRNYLEETQLFEGFQIVSGSTGLGRQTFFEELTAGNGVALLKYYSRKKGANEMLSIVGDTATELTFHHNKIFISNANHQLMEMALSRKSVRKAIPFAALNWEEKIPAVRKEQQLVRFMEKLMKE